MNALEIECVNDATKGADRSHHHTVRQSKTIKFGLCTAAAVVVVSCLSLSSSSFAPPPETNILTRVDRYEYNNPTKFHQSGFGGSYNVGHQPGYRNRHALAAKEVVIPKSAVKHAIPSLAKENIVNLQGHYLHDEHRSPFSSFLYDRPEEELKEEQEEYEAKMNKVREEWGAWDFKDESNVVRPLANFDETPYKDLANDKFPENSWQMSEKYVRDFIKEANLLVDRMMEGIYAEYGHPTKKEDGTTLSEDEIQARNELFQVRIGGANEKSGPGVSYINQQGMDALTRKLLHGMITNDEFYFVLGGHSSAAGHGNNFLQQKTMQFHYIMEPVFHKLGMRLISRNLAMGGLGTLHYSMGQAELYGEKDFLMWDSAMTEKSPGDIDLFNKQALMNGERVPIIFTMNANNLQTETNGSFWHGDIISGKDFIVLTEGIGQVTTLPLAAQYQRCSLSVEELCSDKNNPHKYDAHCWVPRSDVEPKTTPSQGFSSQASWHPGNRAHQSESRKAALTILTGLKNALQIWENAIDETGFPLAESYWHIGDTYKSVQETLTTYINGPGKGTSECEKHFEKFGFERVCRMTMHGMSEFTPVNLGGANSLHAHIKPALNGWVPAQTAVPVYSGIDILPVSWKIPPTEVDVHAIAIATTYKRPQIDQMFGNEDGDDSHYDDDNDDDKGDAENSRSLRNNGIQHRQPLEKVVDRNILSDEVVPGMGWGIDSDPRAVVTGYCDGSAMSLDCHREKNNNCLLSGHNDGRNTISGDGLSGWLVVQIPKLKEGMIFARMEWWHPRDDWYLTEGWTEVNNGSRSLGTPIPWPDDVFIDLAVNGEIVSTWDKAQFDSINVAISYNEAFYKFLDDEDFIQNEEGEPVEFGLRIRSESDPRKAGLSLSHLYYA